MRIQTVTDEIAVTLGLDKASGALVASPIAAVLTWLAVTYQQHVDVRGERDTVAVRADRAAFDQTRSGGNHCSDETDVDNLEGIDVQQVGLCLSTVEFFGMFLPVVKRNGGNR